MNTSQSSEWVNLILTIVKLWIFSGGVLLLHRISSRYGLAPLLVYLGGIAALLSSGWLADASIDLLRGHSDIQISTALSPVILSGVLVLYVVDGTAAARLGIISFLGVAAVALISSPLDQSATTSNLRLITAFIVAFALSQVVVTITYQAVSNRMRRLSWLAAGIALLISLWIGASIPLILSFPQASLLDILQDKLVNSILSTLSVWPLVALYLTHIAPNLTGFAGMQPRRSLDILSRKLDRIDIPPTRSGVQLQQKAQDLSALYDASHIFLSHLEVDTIVENVCKQAVDDFGFEMAWLGLITTNKNNKAEPVTGYSSNNGYSRPEELNAMHQQVAVRTSIDQAFRTSRPVSINHLKTRSADKPHYEAIQENGYRSLSVIPLLNRRQALGVLVIYSSKEAYFTDTRIDILQSFANQAAVALTNARLLEAEQRQMEELIVLHAVATVTAEAASEDQLLEQATQIIGATLYPDNFGVLLLDTDDHVLRLHASYRTRETIRAKTIPLGQGVTGQVAADGHARLVHDVTVESNYLDYEQSTRSELCVPLKIGKHIIGVINAESKSRNAFTSTDERLLVTIASQIATAIEKVRLLQAERRRRQEAETLREATAALTSALDLQQVLDAILINLKRVVPYDSACVFLLQGDDLHAVAGIGFPESQNVIGYNFSASNMLFREIQHTRQPLCLTDAQIDHRFEAWSDTDQIRGWMGVPLISSGEVAGCLTLDNKQRGAYAQAEAELVQAFADHAAIALANAELFTKATEALAHEQHLNEVALIISSALDLPTTLQNVLRLAIEVIGAESGTLALLTPDGQSVSYPHFFNLPAELSTRSIPRGEGLVWQVITDGEPLLVSDYAQHSQATPYWVEAGVRELIAVPLIAGATHIGALELFVLSTQKHFDRRDLALAQSVAAQAAIAIQNARLYESEHKQRTLAEAVRDSTAALNSTLNFNEVLDRILINIEQVVPHDSAAIMLVESGVAYTVRTRHLINAHRDPSLSNLRYPVSEVSNLSRMAKTGQPVAIPDTHSDPGWVMQPDTMWIRSYAGAPIHIKGEVIGFLGLISGTAGFYASIDAEHLQAFADQAAIAIQNARLYAEAQRRLKEQTALQVGSAVISSTLDLNTVLNHIAEQMCRAINTTSAYLCSFDAATPTSTILAEYISSEAHELEKTSDLGVTYDLKQHFPGTIKLLESPQIVVTHIDDPDLPESERRHMQKYGARTSLIIPLQIGGQVIAYAELWESRRRREFTPEEITLCQGIAQQAAIAINNARLFEAEREQRALAVALRNTAAALNSTLNFDEVLDHILATVGDVVPHDSANILLVEDGIARMARHRGYIDSEHEASVFAVRFSVAGTPTLNYMATSGEPLAIPNTQTDTRWVDLPETRWVQSFASAPIRMKGKAIGFLGLNSAKSGFFTDTHAERLQVFADQAAISVENSRLYDAVRRHADELEYRVSERTVELAEANEQLKELDRLKDQFVSNVSHELRTPLANVKLYLGLLEHGRPQKHANYLRTLNRESARLESLIEALLQLSRLDLGTVLPNMVPVDLNQLAADFFTDRTALAADYGLSLDFRPDPDLSPTLTDLSLTTQIMSNLMTNAIHYTPRGGQITLSTCNQQKQDQNWVTFTIRDNGPGISQEDQLRLFDRFFRGEAARDSGKPGTGLGLAICKEMIEIMGGDITFESQLGRGTAFTVWLRRAYNTES